MFDSQPYLGVCIFISVSVFIVDKDIIKGIKVNVWVTAIALLISVDS